MESYESFPPSYISPKQAKKPGAIVFIPYTVKETVMNSTQRLNSNKLSNECAFDAVNSFDNFVSINLDNPEIDQDKTSAVPCYFVRCKTGSSKILLYFHTEKQDLGEESSVIISLCHYLKCHVIAIEYPGFGICFEEKFNYKEVIFRASIVFEYITSQLGFLETDIILMGNSVGSRVAMEISNKYKACACILINMFYQTKSCILSLYYCTGGIKDTCLKKIQSCQCPLLIINSESDNSVVLEILERINEIPQNKEKPHLVDLRPTISNNFFRPNSDIAVPFKKFADSLNQFSFESSPDYPDRVNYLNLENLEDLMVIPSRYNSERLTKKLNENLNSCCSECTIF